MRTHRIRRWCTIAVAAPALLAAGSTTPAAAAEPPAPLVGEAAAGSARYLVVLEQRPGGGGGTDAARRARQAGGKVLRTYSRVLSGYTAELTAAELSVVRRDPAVAYVQADTPVRVVEPVAAGGRTAAQSWGLDRIDQRTRPLDGEYAYDSDGGGVAVYVVDDGVRVTHAEFGGRAETVHDVVGGNPDPATCGRHGTHVAGTVAGATYGVAKGALIKSVRVIDCDGFSAPSWVVGGLEWVAQHARPGSVVNLSLGHPEAALATAADALVDAGLLPVVAAGNDGNRQCTNALAVARAVTVGATDRDDRRPQFSDFGPCVDIWAPGVDIVSAVPADDGATAAYSGTSMATPHVAGWAARYRQTHPAATVDDIRAAVTASATPDVVWDIGTNGVNRLLYGEPGTAAPDTTAPGAPGAPTASAVRYDSVQLSWAPGTDDVRVASYEIRAAVGAQPARALAVTGVTAATVSGLTPATAYRFTVRARDAAGNWSPDSPTVAVTTAPADVTGPSAPGTPTVGRVSANDVSLSWAVSTDGPDGSGVAGYEVERATRTGAFAVVGAPTAPYLTLTGLLPETEYRFRVRARDRSGNWSAYSAEVTASTAAATPGCSVKYRPNPESGGRFSVFPIITNTGTVPIAARWSLRFTLPAGQSVVPPGLGATVTSDGSVVTVTGPDRPLAAGASLSFGLTVTGTGTERPTAYTVNGIACTLI